MWMKQWGITAFMKKLYLSPFGSVTDMLVEKILLLGFADSAQKFCGLWENKSGKILGNCIITWSLLWEIASEIRFSRNSKVLLYLKTISWRKDLIPEFRQHAEHISAILQNISLFIQMPYAPDRAGINVHSKPDLDKSRISGLPSMQGCTWHIYENISAGVSSPLVWVLPVPRLWSIRN